MAHNVWVSVAASVLLAGAASAADLPSRRAPPVYIPPPLPMFTWTGFYAGGNAGYAWSTRDTESTTATGSPQLIAIGQGQLNGGTVPVTHGLAEHGFMGGGQIGYNYQLGSALGGNIVVGVEADIDYSDARHSDTIGAANGTQDAYHSRLEYLGTARGRIGYAFDRVLVYATGGFAYGETTYSHTFLSNQTPPAPIFAGSQDRAATGYAVGGGIEYALPTAFNPFGRGDVTIRAEYLYYDLGAQTTILHLAPAPALDTQLLDRYRTAGNLVRAGLNFKFGESVAAPVVARY